MSDGAMQWEICRITSARRMLIKDKEWGLFILASSSEYLTKKLNALGTDPELT